ncbi:hypothetical protein JZO72_08595 [Vagococcus fluvialis]|uniref:hypothetical protein n=1 Tax=Vagococcus fluvialis TaxID=2738 RepID=UPI001A9086D2|nr:hypothetical protein [Vagococcus fluvialis]MBO0479683.1 hypothetical protein [Vagococcus fluvialis]MBO0483692.1 hypothetical protein [Vagococcus fluvialis]UDM71361.1 hypothetical protein K5L00_00790 [Vagococcus fluvialis]UDM74603.1 hypothetical protein K5K99_03065 [Vagococcus fluvialis]UDM76224.1 hypothetical protein K5K98_10595 [Vagococcus fluvialis]
MKNQEQSKEEMIQYILNQGKIENDAYFDKESYVLNEDFKQKMTKIETDKEARYQKQRAVIKETYEKKIQRIELEKNQSIMLEKQAYLKKVIDKMAVKLKTLSKEESQSFMSSIFISNDLSGQIDVLIGELSQETITQEWLDQLANQNEMPVTYVLSSEVISNDGGFILSQDGIEYNYLYSSILDQISEEKEYDIVSELFKNEVI